MTDARKYYEVRPGADSARYVAVYGIVTVLSRRKRKHRFFTEGSSNIDRHIVADGYFEKGILDALRDVIERTGHNELFVDVGANIGNHTVALADLFKQVESVEPHPVSYHALMANVLRNGLSHVTVHNFGLANEDTSAVLGEPLDTHGAAHVKGRSHLSAEHLGREEDDWGLEFPIELRSATEFMDAFGSKLDQGFIKIDVEGMEQEIVLAMLPSLEKYKPVVGFEWFTKAQPDLGEIVSGLDGYELWGIRSLDTVGPSLAWRAAKLLVKGRPIALERIDLDNVADVYTLALLVPNDKLD